MNEKLKLSIIDQKDERYDWEIKNINISLGMLSSFFNCVDKKTSKNYNLRIIKFEDYYDYQFLISLREIFTTKQIPSEFKLEISDIYVRENSDFNKEKSLIIVYEKNNVNFNLGEIIEFFIENKKKSLKSEENILGIMIQILKKLKKIYKKQKIGLRNLKLSNIIFNVNEFKFSDFSNSILFEKNFEVFDEEIKLPISGNTFYFSPETHKNYYCNFQLPYNVFSSDVFSLGIMFFMLKKSSKKLLNRKEILNSALNLNPKDNSSQLIRIMLDENPKFRVIKTLDFLKKMKNKFPLNKELMQEIEEFKGGKNEFDENIKKGIIAKVYNDFNSLNESISRLKDIVKFFKNNNLTENLMESLNILGEVYLKKKEFEEAKNCFEQSLELRKKFFTEEKGKIIKIIQTFIDLGVVYREIKEFEKSQDNLLEGLEYTKKYFGENHD